MQITKFTTVQNNNALGTQ